MVLVVDHVVAAAANRLVCFILLSPRATKMAGHRARPFSATSGRRASTAASWKSASFRRDLGRLKLAASLLRAVPSRPGGSATVAGPAEQVAGTALRRHGAENPIDSPHQRWRSWRRRLVSIDHPWTLVKIEEPLTMTS